MAFECRLNVRFGDCDRAGIAYYPAIFHMVHTAMEELWEQYFGIPYHAVVNRENFGLPAVKIDSEFFAPLEFGAKPVFRVSLLKLGDKSVTLRYDVLSGDKRKHLARVDVVTVAVDMKTFQPVRFPDKYRARMKRLAVKKNHR